MHTTVKVEVAGEFIIIDAAATAFRQEMDKSGPLARRQSLHWDSHPKMKDAIEKKLFSDVANLVKVTTSTKVLNEQQRARVSEVKERLIDDMGYCAYCAQELLDYVGYLLSM